MNEEGLISNHAWHIIEPPMQRSIEPAHRAVADVLNRDRSMEIAEISNAYREALRAQRSAFNDLFFFWSNLRRKLFTTGGRSG